MQHTERTWEVALIDLDGTLFRGDSVIPGAPEFVERVRGRGIRPVFFTNNATKTPGQVSHKLLKLGIAAQVGEVCTSAQATADWLKRKYGPAAKVIYIGTEGLSNALAELGLRAVHVRDINDCSDSAGPFDAAVMGLDPEATYSELAHFCRLVSVIGSFVLTNADARLPVGDTFAPGNGALGNFVASATGIVPVVIGKPETAFVQYVLKRYRVGADRAVLIGDNVLTDIQGGLKAGVYTIQVKTGVDIPSDINADEVWQSVAELFN